MTHTDSYYARHGYTPEQIEARRALSRRHAARVNKVLALACRKAGGSKAYWALPKAARIALRAQASREIDAGTTAFASITQPMQRVEPAAPFMKTVQVLVRPGQRAFRRAVLRRDMQCVLSGVSEPRLLDAAHIKPASICGDGEYYEVDNGLTLRCDLHRAFDLALFTIDDDGQTIVKPGSGLIVYVPLIVRVRMTLRQREFLKGHRRWFRSINNLPNPEVVH